MSARKRKAAADKARELVKNGAGATDKDTEDRPLSPTTDGQGDEPSLTPPVEAAPAETPTPAPNETNQDETGLEAKYNELLKQNRTLQERFNSLRGKYDQEVPRLHRMLQDAQSAPAPLLPTAKINPDDYKEFGEEIVAMATMLSEISASVGSVKADVGNVKTAQLGAEQRATDSYWDKIYQAVPEFEAINNDPKFLQWLNGYIDTPNGMQLRNNVLQGAHAAMTAIDVIGIFKSYLTENDQPAAPSSQQPNISPSPSVAQPVQPPDGKPSYTRAQVDVFFKDLAMGKFSHDPDWAAKEKQRILVAGREGRIR